MEKDVKSIRDLRIDKDDPFHKLLISHLYDGMDESSDDEY